MGHPHDATTSQHISSVKGITTSTVFSAEGSISQTDQQSGRHTGACLVGASYCVGPCVSPTLQRKKPLLCSNLPAIRREREKQALKAAENKENKILGMSSNEQSSKKSAWPRQMSEKNEESEKK